MKRSERKCTKIAAGGYSDSRSCALLREEATAWNLFVTDFDVCTCCRRCLRCRHRRYVLASSLLIFNFIFSAQHAAGKCIIHMKWLATVWIHFDRVLFLFWTWIVWTIELYYYFFVAFEEFNRLSLWNSAGADWYRLSFSSNDFKLLRFFEWQICLMTFTNKIEQITATNTWTRHIVGRTDVYSFIYSFQAASADDFVFWFITYSAANSINGCSRARFVLFSSFPEPSLQNSIHRSGFMLRRPHPFSPNFISICCLLILLIWWSEHTVCVVRCVSITDNWGVRWLTAAATPPESLKFE